VAEPQQQSDLEQPSTSAAVAEPQQQSDLEQPSTSAAVAELQQQSDLEQTLPQHQLDLKQPSVSTTMAKPAEGDNNVYVTLYTYSWYKFYIHIFGHILFMCAC